MTEQTNRLSLLDHRIAQVVLRLVFFYGLFGMFKQLYESIGVMLGLLAFVGILFLIIDVPKKALVIRGWQSRLRAVLLLVFLVPTTLYLDGGWVLVADVMVLMVLTMALWPLDEGVALFVLFMPFALGMLMVLLSEPEASILVPRMAIFVARIAIVVASFMLVSEQPSKESADGRRLQGWYAGEGDYSGGGGCSGGGD